MEENDHQLLAKALRATQGSVSLALSCVQAQLWVQSVVAAVTREGEDGTLPTEICKLIWDKASEFEKESQSWWQVVQSSRRKGYGCHLCPHCSQCSGVRYVHNHCIRTESPWNRTLSLRAQSAGPSAGGKVANN